jgi:hypothetical protein
MEHPDELLEKLSYTESIILTYKPIKKMFGLDTLMYYITKSEYRGVPVILCFTNSDIVKYTKKVTTACECCVECSRSIIIDNNIVRCIIKIGDNCYHLQFTKSIFDARVCNRTVIIFNLLEHIYLTPVKKLDIYNPVVYSNYSRQIHTASLKASTSNSHSYMFYPGSSMLHISPCVPFYKSAKPYTDSVQTRAMVNTYLKYPKVFNLLYSAI